MRIDLAGGARGFTRQGRASAWFQDIVKRTADTQKLWFFVRLDKVLAQCAAGSMYAGNGPGALSTVSTPPGSAHAHEGGSGWSACEETFLHGTIEGICLLLYGTELALFLGECTPATTPLLVLLAGR